MGQRDHLHWSHRHVHNPPKGMASDMTAGVPRGDFSDALGHSRFPVRADRRSVQAAQSGSECLIRARAGQAQFVRPLLPF